MGVLSPRRRIVGCTIASASYGAYALVLAARWHELHPDLPFFLLLLDGEPAAFETEGLRAIRCDQIGLTPAEVEIRRGMYNAWELATSLKVELLRALLAEGHEAAVYLDPDTGLYGAVGDVGEVAVEHGIALSPHLLRPAPSDGLYPSEQDILEFGIFNGGLIAVGQDAVPFLEWWSGHVRRDCLDERTVGLHADQTWLQVVPQYFPYTVLLDPTLHVAHWNVHERNIELVDGRYFADGWPLRTFHFSQFDPDRPELLSTWVAPARYRVDPVRHPAVFQLLREYAAELAAAGHRERRTLGYAYATSAAGIPLGKWERAVYREALLAAEARGTVPPPSPFDPARADDFERLVHPSATLPGLSEEARRRLEGLRPRRESRSLPARLGRRLLRAARYAGTGRLSAGLDSTVPARVASDVVLREYPS